MVILFSSVSFERARVSAATRRFEDHSLFTSHAQGREQAEVRATSSAKKVCHDTQSKKWWGRAFRTGTQEAEVTRHRHLIRSLPTGSRSGKERPSWPRYSTLFRRGRCCCLSLSDLLFSLESASMGNPPFSLSPNSNIL